MRSRLLILIATALLYGPGIHAQAYSDAYPGNPGTDVIGYVFDIEVTDTEDVIRGRTAVDVRFVEPSSSLRLDLIGRTEERDGLGMSVTGVASDGHALVFTHAEDVLVIDLGREAEAGERVTVHVSYEGIPAAGLTIGPNKYGDRSFFSDNWSSRVRNWLPVVDHPSEKATTEMRVVAPSHYQVASNGTLAEHSDLAGGRRLTHWKNPVPTAPWLYFLGVARMAVQVVDTWNGVPIETWVYWQDRDAGFHDFAEPSKKVLAFYSDLIGPYVYLRLANIVSNGTPGGGMEAASTPAYSDQSVSGNRERRWQHVIIHEIAHQWFGNAVTESTWNDVWLSEGFATYYTLLFREHLYGRDDFRAGLLDARQRVLSFYADDYDFQIVRPYVEDLNDVSGAMMYQKGAWILHMLREKVGVDAYNEGVRAYYAEFMNRNARTEDFRRHMEAASGMDLKPYFHQWLFQGGVPTVAANWWMDAGTLHYTIRQTQARYEYDLGVDVQFRYADGTFSDIIAVRLPLVDGEAAEASGSVPVGDGRRVVEMILDPNVRLLAAFDVRNGR
ncbi:MAG: M1 family metallopeptidase [Gemmatimonadota bacterium]